MEFPPRRTTSVRLSGLEELETVVRSFGFKDRSHFFQLATDALLFAHREGSRLEWPPRFLLREKL
jgi:hypothetical protein